MKGLVVLGALFVTAIATAAPQNLVGRYVGWAFSVGYFSETDGSNSKTVLELRPDGTYRMLRHDGIRGISNVESTGRYERKGSQLLLSGTTHSTFDDFSRLHGSRKEESHPHHQNLRIENGMLATNHMGGPFYYRKAGAGAPPLPPSLRLRRSEPRAVDLVKKVQRTYRTLGSYIGDGTMISGGNSQPRRISFRIAFRRPSQFRYESLVGVAFNGKPDGNGWVEITWDGKKTWWYRKQDRHTTGWSLRYAVNTT